MVWCCVPNCKSQQGRDKEVSFHEFPINESLKGKWTHALDFTPTEFDKVCSRHFVNTDFSTSTTRRRLLPHAVPRKFPVNLSNENASQRSVKRPRRRDCLPSKISSSDENLTNTPSIRQTPLSPAPKAARISNDIRPNVAAALTVSDNFQTHQYRPTHVTNVPESGNVQALPLKLVFVETRSCNCCGTKVDTADITRNFQDVGIQVDNLMSRRSCPDNTIKMYKSKFRCCKKQLLRLQRRMAALKQRQAEMSKLQANALQHKKVDAIVCGAKEGNRRAMFLLEQINVFGQTKPRWQETTVRLCTVWQERYPKSYNFVRNVSILNLPHAVTLKRFEENTVSFREVEPLVSSTLLSTATIESFSLAGEEQPSSFTIDEDAVFSLPDAAGGMLVDQGALLQGAASPATHLEAGAVEIASDAAHQLCTDHALIENVPMSLLHQSNLGSMSDMSLSSHNLIQNFVLTHHRQGDGEDGVALTEMSDGGTNCCMVQDSTLCDVDGDGLSELPSLPENAEPDLQLALGANVIAKNLPTSGCGDDDGCPALDVIESSATIGDFHDEMMLTRVDSSESLVDEEDCGQSIPGRASELHDDDLMGNVNEAFTDGVTDMEL